MRVLYSFPGTIGAPGTGTTAARQIGGLIVDGHEVTVCATSLRAPLVGVRRVATTLTVGGRRVPHRVLGIARSQRRHDRCAAALLRRLKDEIDVVHCWPQATIQVARAAREIGVPSFREVPNTHTAHAFEVAAAESLRLGVQQARGLSHTPDPQRLAVEEHEYRLADVLLVPSDYAGQTFVDRGIEADRLRVHRYGCDPERFAPLPAPPGADSSRGLTALFCGSLEPRKGLHLALRAWIDSGAAERGRFIVLGGFVPGYYDALGELVTHPSVELHGFVDDVPAMMTSADVFVFPSLEEGSALVTYEAQAAGCVPLVSDAAGARCNHDEHGLVHAAGDIAALTAHLRSVDRDRELLLRLRRAALAHVPELTWDGAGRELAEIYATVAARAHHRPAPPVAVRRVERSRA